MKDAVVLALLLAACASPPRSESVDHTVLEGYSVESVREAARGVLEELAYGQWDVRASNWRVMTEGWFGRCDEDVDCNRAVDSRGGHKGGSPWTTVEVRFGKSGTNTAVEVRITYLSDALCNPGLTEPKWLDVKCIPERLGSTGALERKIVERIRARLEEEEPIVTKIP